MKAKVTKEFPGRPDDEPLARTIVEGEVIFGDLARVAIEIGFAEEVKEGADVSPPEDGLDDLTIAELEALSTDRGVDLGTAKKKAEIVAALRAAAEPLA